MARSRLILSASLLLAFSSGPAVAADTSAVAPPAAPGAANGAQPPSAVPTLLEPSGNRDFNAGPPVFTWRYRGPIALPTFDLYIVNPATRAMRLRPRVASGYRLPPKLALPEGCYQWRVRAHDPASPAGGDWSPAGEFCLARPAAPVPLLPDQGIGDTSGGPYTPTFTWSHPAAPPNTVYDLSIRCLDSGAAIDKTGLSGTYYTLAGEAESLPTDPSCRWTIRGRNARTGAVTEESAQSFNTLDVPTPSAILFSGTGAAEWQATPTFLLGHPHFLHQGSVSYDLEIVNPALDETTRRTAIAGTFVDEETREVELDTSLAAGYSYVYFIRARDDAYGTEGAWSESATFSVPLYGDLSPTDLEPGGAVSGPPSFSWNFVGGDSSTRFDLYLYNLTDDSLVFSGTTDLPGSRFDPVGLDLSGGKSYILWVRAKDSTAGGVGPWSSGAVFSVQ